MNEGAAALNKRPLDDVMLAMDVVDTLRHQRKVVTRELDEANRDQQLLEQLRKIYAAQGIGVPDHVLEEGVAALKEERFVYKPPAAGFATRMANLYVSRGQWGKWVLGAFAALMLAGITYYVAVIAPRGALPGDLQAMHASVVEVAKSDKARATAEQIYAAARAALRDDDETGARAALQSLEDLRTELEREYSLRIVSRPGERSGVWRNPELNPSARNYYIVVEALDASGKTLTVHVTNEETGETEAVSRWALRVDQEMYERIAADKQDDGIIQNNRFGVKHRGYLEPDYASPISGGAITRW